MFFPPEECSGVQSQNMNQTIISRVCLNEKNFFFSLSKCCVSETLHVKNLSAEIIVTEIAQSSHLAQIMHLSNKQTGCVSLKRLS